MIKKIYVKPTVCTKEVTSFIPLILGLAALSAAEAAVVGVGAGFAATAAAGGDRQKFSIKQLTPVFV